MKTFTIHFTDHGGTSVTVGNCRNEQDAKNVATRHLLYKRYTVDRIEEVQLTFDELPLRSVYAYRKNVTNNHI